MKIIELPTGDWVDPGTVEKVYKTTRSVPHIIHVVVVQCFGSSDLSYEYPSLDACRENCARIGKVIREAQDGECKLTVDNQPAPQLPCPP